MDVGTFTVCTLRHHHIARGFVLHCTRPFSMLLIVRQLLLVLASTCTSLSLETCSQCQIGDQHVHMHLMYRKVQQRCAPTQYYQCSAPELLQFLYCSCFTLDYWVYFILSIVFRLFYFTSFYSFTLCCLFYSYYALYIYFSTQFIVYYSILFCFTSPYSLTFGGLSLSFYVPSVYILPTQFILPPLVCVSCAYHPPLPCPFIILYLCFYFGSTLFF